MKNTGHILVAAQVPVRLANVLSVRMTQVDLITMNALTHELEVWEVKSGFPQGFYRKQGFMRCDPIEHVECTKPNIWHLQLRYTQLALEAALGLQNRTHARVIHAYEKKNTGICLKILEQPEWCKRISVK